MDRGIHRYIGRDGINIINLTNMEMTWTKYTSEIYTR